jgi:hypothetical protein
MVETWQKWFISSIHGYQTTAPRGRCTREKDRIMAANIWTFPPTADSIPFLIGYDVVATDGKIGSIDEHSLASDSSYIVLNTGWWLFERKHLIPCGFISSIDGDAGKILLSKTRREVRAAPVFKPIEHSSESGRYRDCYGPA